MMFVTTTRYNNLLEDYKTLKTEFSQQITKWNDLVTTINNKGGEDFLENAQILQDKVLLEKSDIKKLISLCHPDKHRGKDTAIEMTQKLLLVRK